MNEAIGLLGLGFLNGFMNGRQQKQDTANYNKGLSAILSYADNNDPNSQAAQAAYLAKTYSDPAYQGVDTRLNAVNKVVQDKNTWGTQNDIMTKAAQDAANLRNQLAQQGIDQSYLSPDLSASGLSGLLANADEATKAALNPLLNNKTQYETAQAARDAAANQANVDRQGLAGIANLVGADVDLSKMPQDATAYMAGINLTPDQIKQYTADKANPAAAMAKNYDPVKYKIGLQQALLNSGVKMDTLQKLSPFLQDAAQNTTENSTKQKYSQFIPSLLNGNPAQQKWAIINMYLTDPNRMPYEVMKELVSNNIKSLDSNNQIQMYRTDSYNNFLDTDQNGKPIPYFAVDKQPTPDTVLRVGEQRFEYTNPSANTLAQLNERKYEHDSPSGNARLQSDTQKYLHSTPSGTAMYQAQTPGKNADVNKIKAMAQYLNLKYKLNPDEMVKDPVYNAYVEAIQGSIGGSGGQDSGMSQTMQDFANRLNVLIQNHGPDAARQWIQNNSSSLTQQGIDPNQALTWVP
jgi:hypothetical protein